MSLSYVSLRSPSLAANLKRVNIAEALRILAESPLCAREVDPHESVTLVAADTAERKEPAGTGEAQAVGKALEDNAADLAVFEADTASFAGSATAASGPVQVIEADSASCGDGQGDELDVGVVTGLVGSRVTAAVRCEAHNVMTCVLGQVGTGQLRVGVTVTVTGSAVTVILVVLPGFF